MLDFVPLPAFSFYICLFCSLYLRCRLAFQALFSREVLPQSFSLPHDLRKKGRTLVRSISKLQTRKVTRDIYQLDLNGKTWANSSNDQEVVNNASLRSLNVRDEGLLTLGKLKVRRTDLNLTRGVPWRPW